MDKAFDLSFAFLSLFFPILRHRISSHLLNSFLKCLPMTFLVGVLALQPKKSSYSRNVLLGLACSTVGDVFLVYTDVCTHSLLGGIVAFGIVHVFYIRAFGLQPFKLSGAVIVAGVQLVAFIVLRPELNKMGPVYLAIIPLYTGLLLLMAWRASAASSGKWSGLRKVGAFSFLVSDGILALTEVTGLVSMPAPVSTVLILSTYYLAQYCFAKTALNESASKAVSGKRQ